MSVKLFCLTYMNIKTVACGATKNCSVKARRSCTTSAGFALKKEKAENWAHDKPVHQCAPALPQAPVFSPSMS